MELRQPETPYHSDPCILYRSQCHMIFPSSGVSCWWTLKKRLATPWTWSKFIATGGAVTRDVVPSYLESQKGV